MNDTVQPPQMSGYDLAQIEAARAEAQLQLEKIRSQLRREEAEHMAKLRAPLFAALAKAQGGFKELVRSRHVKVRTKDRETGAYNGEYEFDYAPLDEVHAATRDALSENGLSITGTLRPAQNGYELTVILGHSSGASLQSTALIEGADWQKRGSSITYARRYIEQAVLGVAAEWDDDGLGDAGNDIVDARQRAPRQAPPQQPVRPQQTAAKPVANHKDRHDQKPAPAKPMAESNHDAQSEGDDMPRQEPKAPANDQRKSEPPPPKEAPRKETIPPPPKEEQAPAPKDANATIPITAGTRDRIKAEIYRLGALATPPQPNPMLPKTLVGVILRGTGKDPRSLSEADGVAFHRKLTTYETWDDIRPAGE